MRKVIMADVGRVQKKAGYIVCMSIIVFLFVLAGILAMVLPLKLDGVKSPAKTMEIYATGIFVFYSFLVGIPIFLVVVMAESHIRFFCFALQTILLDGIVNVL